MLVFKASLVNKVPQANVVLLALLDPWALLETKDPRENVDCPDRRALLDPRVALENREKAESPERRVPMDPSVAPVTKVHQDQLVPLVLLDVMAHLESPDPLDPQVSK